MQISVGGGLVDPVVDRELADTAADLGQVHAAPLLRWLHVITTQPACWLPPYSGWCCSCRSAAGRPSSGSSPLFAAVEDADDGVVERADVGDVIRPRLRGAGRGLVVVVVRVAGWLGSFGGHLRDGGAG
jgi:hypothetical protein